MTEHYILSIDQGTTSSRAMLFDSKGLPVASAQKEFTQFFPKNGWVEHDPEEIWSTTLECCREVLKKRKLSASQIAGIGITNQRETTVIWDRETGKPVYNAIVWQDRRTADICQALKKKNLESSFQEKTGLLLDPYFSGTKIKWILDNVEGVWALASKGKLAFGTIDTFLLWRLTGGKVHATDITNASRTLLFNIKTLKWDEELLKIMDIPESLLPEVKKNIADYGKTDPELFGEPIQIGGVAGDQQAALIGQACFDLGMVKSTYGTGCFAIVNTGEKLVHSKKRLLSTIAYQFDDKPCYAIEGSIFVAGAAIQWLRDGLGLFAHASETEKIVAEVNDNGGVYFVPALTGLGAPYWDAEARGVICGLTRDTKKAHLVRAALEAQAYQTRDLLEAMMHDMGASIATLRVDGGMVINNWVCQILSDINRANVERPVVNETTALGAAYLAGLQSGFFTDLNFIRKNWHLDQAFDAKMDEKAADKLYNGWLSAVKKAQSR